MVTLGFRKTTLSVIKQPGTFYLGRFPFRECSRVLNILDANAKEMFVKSIFQGKTRSCDFCP